MGEIIIGIPYIELRKKRASRVRSEKFKMQFTEEEAADVKKWVVKRLEDM